MSPAELREAIKREDLKREADASLARRLCWQYGPEEGMRRARGESAEAEADKAAWRNLAPPPEPWE